MSRRKGFDESDILTKSMFVFYDNGYNGTSVNDIGAVTGLRPGSIYHSFGSKHGLFLRVIEHYSDVVVGVRVAKFLRDGPPLEAVRDFFTSAVDHAIEHGRACLLANTAIEFGTRDQEIANRVTTGLRRIEDGFEDHLERSRQGGLLTDLAEIRPLASSLLASFFGVLVVARTRPDRAHLYELVEAALAPIPSRRNLANSTRK